MSHRTILILLSLTLGFVVTEIGMRFLFNDILQYTQDERNLTYRYDKELGWFPIKNSHKSYKGSRSIDVKHNRRGFRDIEHVVTGKPKILFLGDSFLWGYDVEQNERFTEKLSEKIKGWSIYNLGVSGYGTDQELLLLKMQYDYYRPNIVFLLFCNDNDEFDNTHNVVYGGYYKPYFTISMGSLVLNGVPVPQSENFFLANHKLLARLYWFRLFARSYFKIKSPRPLELDNPTPAIILSINEMVKAEGAKLVVGSTGSDPYLAEFLDSWQIGYIDLNNPYRYSSHGFHWTPAGHSFVSEKIYNFLNQEGYLTSDLN